MFSRFSACEHVNLGSSCCEETILSPELCWSKARDSSLARALVWRDLLVRKIRAKISISSPLERSIFREKLTDTCLLRRSGFVFRMFIAKWNPKCRWLVFRVSGVDPSKFQPSHSQHKNPSKNTFRLNPGSNTQNTFFHLNEIMPPASNGISTANLNWFSLRSSGCHQQLCYVFTRKSVYPAGAAPHWWSHSPSIHPGGAPSADQSTQASGPQSSPRKTDRQKHTGNK